MILNHGDGPRSGLRLLIMFTTLGLCVFICCGVLGSNCIGVTTKVNIAGGTSQNASPCETIILTATVDQEGATISWAQTGGKTATLTDNGDGSATVTFPSNASVSAPDQFDFTATGSKIDFSNVSASVTISMNNAIVSVGTKNSGAAQPGNTVVLELADIESSGWIVSWEQDVSDTDLVDAITPTGQQSATFVAPIVTTSTTLNFNASGQCADQIGVELTGAISVPVQVATLTFNLPTEVTVGDTLQLDSFVTAQGAPATVELLFFANDDGALPPGVIVSIDQDTKILTVDAGSATGTIQVTVQIFGTAGLLDEVTKSINIVP